MTDLERKRKWVQFLATVDPIPRTHRIEDDPAATTVFRVDDSVTP